MATIPPNPNAPLGADSDSPQHDLSQRLTLVLTEAVNPDRATVSLRITSARGHLVSTSAIPETGRKAAEVKD